MITKVSSGFLVCDLDADGHEQEHSVTLTCESAVMVAVGALRYQARQADRRAKMFARAAHGTIDRLDREEVVDESEAIHFAIHMIRLQLDSLIAFLDPEGAEDEQEHDAKPNGLSTEAHKFASAIESIERTNPEAARMFVQAMEQLAGGTS